MIVCLFGNPIDCLEVLHFPKLDQSQSAIFARYRAATEPIVRRTPAERHGYSGPLSANALMSGKGQNPPSSRRSGGVRFRAVTGPKSNGDFSPQGFGSSELTGNRYC